MQTFRYYLHIYPCKCHLILAAKEDRRHSTAPTTQGDEVNALIQHRS